MLDDGYISRNTGYRTLKPLYTHLNDQGPSRLTKHALHTNCRIRPDFQLVAVTLINMIKHDWRPKHHKAGDTEKDRKRVQSVKVSFVDREVSGVALGIFGDTEEGSDLREVLEGERLDGMCRRTR